MLACCISTNNKALIFSSIIQSQTLESSSDSIPLLQSLLWAGPLLSNFYTFTMTFNPVMNIDIGDHDPADPLNPMVNYTHFHPSAEQQDPYIPLGFKIYGIGCLVAFIIFLFVVLIYAIRQIYKHRHKGEDEQVSPGDALSSKCTHLLIPADCGPGKT
jgi:hypothetical protein